MVLANGWCKGFYGESDMKKFIYLIGLLSLLAGSGCVIREEHHRGRAYDPYYRDYGHDSYRPYDRDRYWEYHRY